MNAEREPNVVIEESGGVYPFQAYGTVGGSGFYLRERGGLEIHIGTPNPAAPTGIDVQFSWYGEWHTEAAIKDAVSRAFSAFLREGVSRNPEEGGRD